MKETSSRLWTGQYILVLSVTALFFVSLQSLMGGFPIYVTDMSGSAVSGGLMTTVFMGAAVLSRPIISMIMPNINMKKWLLGTMIGVLLAVICSYFVDSLAMYVILRILQGIGFGFATTMLATLTTDRIPDQRLGEGIGYFGLATSIGTTIGPTIAISMIHNASFQVLLLFSAALLAVLSFSVIWVKRVQPEVSEEIRASAAVDVKKNILQSAFDSKAFFPCFLVMLFYITFAGVVNFLDGLGVSNGLGAHTSVFFIVIAGMLIVTRPFSGVIFDRFGHAYLIYPAILACIAGLFLLMKSSSMTMLIAAGIFYGLAYGVMQPTFQALAVSSVAAENKATANAMTLSFMDLGQAIGALVLGQAVGIVGYTSMFGLAALLAVFMLVAYWVYHVSQKRKKMIAPHSSQQV